jgi:UDP-N-acetylglucosamine--N-acetylmuramyl-(pentapeptide) pyrophosphoryl-undecaprenol N-acetylglucosamine transferase
MIMPPSQSPHVAIACGGTGGHLFPGIAVGREVLARGGRVTLFISEKEVDQRAVLSVQDMRVVALPSIGLQRGRVIAFFSGLLRSRRIAGEQFGGNAPHVVLAMGGFTSAGPVLAAGRFGAACYLHDSNVIPGRANRWLARFANEVFVAFAEAQARFKAPTRITGTPVRPEFHSVDPGRSREALGLRVEDPVLLVTGGSQGASAINRLMQEALPVLAGRFRRLQYIHLTGPADLASVQGTYEGLGAKALVRAFCAEMHHALGAATLTVSRAGGSSIAEIAATRSPAVLIPYPEAADRHQSFNAAALERRGAAVVVEQNALSGSAFAARLMELLGHPAKLAALRENLSTWQPPKAAGRIVDAMFRRLPFGVTAAVNPQSTPGTFPTAPLQRLQSLTS